MIGAVFAWVRLAFALALIAVFGVGLLVLMLVLWPLFLVALFL